MSSSSENPGYNVYLSFCEEEGSSFALYLSNALSQIPGVRVFCANKFSLTVTDWKYRLNVLRKSKLAIIEFSCKYTTSKLYLKELEKIMECSRTTGLMLLPLFIDSRLMCNGVVPFYENMSGKVFKEFVDRLIPTNKENEDKFMSWVAAISKYKAYVVTDSTSNIKFTDIIPHVTDMLKRDKFDANYPVGVGTPVQDVIQLLQQSEQPFLLGIWGMVGIGKTTIAKAVYEQIGDYFYESKFFEFFESFDDFSKLQFGHKRVLMVLDNVTKLEEFKALWESRAWFSAGSKIIITTRDRHLLKLIGVHHIYSVKGLDQSESLEVFNSYAFKEASPNREFVELSRQFAACSGGLPLALSIIGSLLPKTDLSKLEYMLQTLKYCMFLC